MLHRLAILVLASICGLGLGTPALGTPAPAEVNSTTPTRMGVYIATNDLEQSEIFYKMLFALEPEIKFPGFTGFNIAGGLFAIVSRAQFAPESVIGARTVPYIKVASVSDLHKRLQATMTAQSLSNPVHEAAISILKIRDPEGNLIEFYSIP